MWSLMPLKLFQLFESRRCEVTQALDVVKLSKQNSLKCFYTPIKIGKRYVEIRSRETKRRRVVCWPVTSILNEAIQA